MVLKPDEVPASVQKKIKILTRAVKRNYNKHVAPVG